MASSILFALVLGAGLIMIVRTALRASALRGAISDAFNAKMIYDKMTLEERASLEDDGIQKLMEMGVSQRTATFMMKERNGVFKFNQLAYVLSAKGIKPIAADQSFALVDRPGLLMRSQEANTTACIQRTAAAFEARYGVHIDLWLDQ